MLNVYCQFINNMREIRTPLDKLTSPNVKFEWTKECEIAFQKAKSALQSDLLLTHFDPSKPIILAGDASKNGIGGVIMHKFSDGTKKPISHASRSLTPAEYNYSQPEKEALALIFFVKKFHRMIHGRNFTLHTDHQPLLSIFGSKKGIPTYTANRLQRWVLILRAYDFNIEYINTKKFGYADALSRLINQTPINTDDEFIIASIKFEAEVNRVLTDIISNIPVSAEDIQTETRKDRTLQIIIKYMTTSWPTSVSTIRDKNIKMFFNRRDSLSQNQGCILSQNRVVIPFSLQKKVLKQLHIGHPGVVRMKALARSYVYWPNIDKDIADLVKQCNACASVAPAPVKAPLSSWLYLIIVDAFSKWPEIFCMSTTTSTATILKLTEVFSRFGLPDILVSDNGSQFTSNQFAEFCSKGGIQHIRISL